MINNRAIGQIMNQSLTQQPFAGLVHSLENRLVRVKSSKRPPYEAT
ncbi:MULTISPECIES: hypothetical protein [Paenibacillus]|nr:hypothetical protein [Paenibacillus sp. 7523-1]MBM6383926.1 hypothetical protein [Paenibacillus sp.]